ncbi:hypothetical protein F5Y06DRAFT_299545 [Hypoxylon sp. FL0890]|nr:hypothetical protein F5Y06DRAFT_299545 [Hypoxylon sp. FL0890]
MERFEGIDPEAPRCVACGEVKPQTRVLPCRDVFCRDCLIKFFEVGLQDRSIWPPRCHGQPTTEHDVAWTESDDLLEKFRQVGHGRDLTNPLWCAQPRCSTLLEEENVMDDGRDAVTCDKCQITTCKKCKKAHNPKETECKDSDSDVVLDEMAKVYKWRRCPYCLIMVSRKGGCKRIRCVCGHHFCYMCGSSRATCDCVDTSNGDDCDGFFKDEDRYENEQRLPYEERMPRLELGYNPRDFEVIFPSPEIQESFHHHYDFNTADALRPTTTTPNPTSPQTYPEARHIQNPFLGQQPDLNHPRFDQYVLHPSSLQALYRPAPRNQATDPMLARRPLTAENLRSILSLERTPFPLVSPGSSIRWPLPDLTSNIYAERPRHAFDVLHLSHPRVVSNLGLTRPRHAFDVLHLSHPRVVSNLGLTRPPGYGTFIPSEDTSEMDDMIPSPHNRPFIPEAPLTHRERVRQRLERSFATRPQQPIREPRQPPAELRPLTRTESDLEAWTQRLRNLRLGIATPTPQEPRTPDPRSRRLPPPSPGRGNPRQQPRPPR